MEIRMEASREEREASLSEYMEMVLRMMPEGLAALIKSRGRKFEAAPLPEDIERGEMKMCFRNAMLLARERSDLTYVEGYACRFIPTLHAWCVTVEGKVIDPTWDEPEACAYYGIPFKSKFALRATMKSKVWGLLGDPATATRISKLDPKEYTAELPA